MGLFFGNLVLEITYRNQKWLKSSTSGMIVNAIGLLASAITIHMAIDQLMGKSGGANWSVARAEKWCKKAEWIYVDTTPHYTLVSTYSMGFQDNINIIRKKNLLFLEIPSKNFVKNCRSDMLELRWDLHLAFVFGAESQRNNRNRSNRVHSYFGLRELY